MTHATKLIDIELSRPLPAIDGLEAYAAVQALLRLHGDPIGYVTIPSPASELSTAAVRTAILDQCGDALWRRLADESESRGPGDWDRLMQSVAAHVSRPAAGGPTPLVTVVVCTRDNPYDLERCLRSLLSLTYPATDILVVDNAPSSNATRDLVATEFSGVRYVREPQRGLSRARNRAILNARGEIIAFTDDDVVADPAWLDYIVDAFSADDVMAVTGLVVPLELETEAQVFVERYGGFGCGFERTTHGAAAGTGAPHRVAVECGTGANMAFRLQLFERTGMFDTGLGAGAATAGGEELEMFFRLLRHGCTLVYEPAAIIRHRHHRSYLRLRDQMAGWGSGFAGYLLTGARNHPGERGTFLRLGVRWLWWQGRRLLASLARPAGFPRGLILAELAGAVRGTWNYGWARRAERARVGAPPASSEIQ